MSYFDRNPIGRLVTRLTSDVDVLNEMFAAGAMTIFMDVLTMTGIIVIMLSINVRLALVSLAVMPFMILGLSVAGTCAVSAPQARIRVDAAVPGRSTAGSRAAAAA